ncbi:hypothetical protein F5Y09DRAFT_299413 [Xylaria sp. FL1042]|nr:hypothetical protein F5Y09DRAFT_299413 [Xylaria sp. FL1042]
MSPKIESSTVSSVTARPAWSRDVGPNTSGVTYSRRSYYYDREFSDSIVRPTDEYFPSSDGLARQRNVIQSCHGGGGSHVAVKVSSTSTSASANASAWIRPGASISLRSRRIDDPFTRGRVLQSASDADDGIELLQSNPPDGAQPETPVVVSAATGSNPGLNIAGLDVQTIARGIVFAADVFVRMAEVYQRLREDEEEEEASESDVDTDPYHLEAGPPRQCRRAASGAPPERNPRVRFTSPRRALAKSTAAAAAAAISTSNETQGRPSSSSHATSMRMLPAPPLSAAKRVCYYLIATAVLGVVMSFTIAVWWALSQGDAAAGFTIGGYVIAVDALIVGIVGVVHKPGCRCWKA